MSNLPEEFEASTRRQWAQLMARVLKLAVYPGRYIKATPIPPGWLPRVSKKKARSYIYPTEDAKLLACKAIPLWRRLLWGFIAREGTRGPSEALSFKWRHVDLVRGIVRLDENKTDLPRFWTLNPGVARALVAWKERTAEGRGEEERLNERIFVSPDGNMPDPGDLADVFRKDLVLALGKDLRPEVLEHNDHRIQIRAHDLRASFVSLALANGKSETWVTDRTGHTSSQQLVNYRRAARTFTELHLGDWTPLDAALPELRPDPSASPVDCPPGGSDPSDSGQDGPDFPEETGSPEETDQLSALLIRRSRVRVPLGPQRKTMRAEEPHRVRLPGGGYFRLGPPARARKGDRIRFHPSSVSATLATELAAPFHRLANLARFSLQQTPPSAGACHRP